MRAIVTWTAAHVRHRWMMLVVLGLVIGVAGAAALTALAGARRTATTYDRHLEATAGPHAMVTTDFDPALWRPDVLDPLLTGDDVEASTAVVAFAMRPAGTEAYLLFEVAVFGALDDRFGTELHRFRIVEGRAYDHRREDEVVVTTEIAERMGVGVGDELRFESWTGETLAASITDNFAPALPDAPPIEATIVGVTREFQQLLPTENPGAVYFTHAFAERRLADIGIAMPFGLLRLEAENSWPAFDARVRATGADLERAYLSQQPTAATAQVDGAIDAQVLALLVFALVAAGAGLVAGYAATARELSVANDDQPSLRALGVTRAERLMGVVGIGVVPALVAGVAAAVGALLASAWFPIGTPGRIEPDPGVRADPLVLVGGAAVTAALVLALSAFVGITITRISDRPVEVARPARSSAIARWVASSAPVSVGVGMALDRGRGSRALPVRTTLAGCVIGLAGAVAALVFSASLGHLTSTPRLYGLAADVMVGTGGGPEEWRQLADRLEADPDVEQVATVISLTLLVDDEPNSGLIVDPRRGDPVNVMVSGRAPRAGDEIVMGSAQADRLGVGEGDTVSIAMADGTASRYTVVGIAAHFNAGESYRDQVALLGDSIEPFMSFDSGPWYGTVVTFRDGVDIDAAIAGLQSEGLIAFPTSLAGTPPAIVNLDEIHVFPLVLAGLLGLLAAAALLHALALAARRRGHELAVLRALGFSSGQLRAVSLSQAATVALIALAVGLPVGLAVGRTAWTVVAGNLGVVIEHLLPGSLVLWAAATLVVAAALSLAVGHGALHERPAQQLRPAHRE
jgi:ABC-type lipoprotein release transport system permease subunit